MTLIVFITLLTALESGVAAAFARLPDRGGWKKWTAGACLIAFAALCVYFPVALHIKKSSALRHHLAVCDLAEQKIRSGQRAELSSRLARLPAVNYGNLLQTAQDFHAKLTKEIP